MNHVLKVLLVAADVNRIGGIEQYNRNVLSGLAAAGVESRLVELKGIGIGQKAGFVARVAREVLRWRPDLVWCAHLHFAPVLYLLKKTLGVRYLVALYGIETIRIREFLQARALEAADLLTPIAHYTAANVLAQIPRTSGRILLIPNSVDGGRFTPSAKPAYLLERHGLHGRPVILTVARLNIHEHKGYDRVIDALPLVLREVPEARYVLVGGGEDDRASQALRRHGLRDEVILAGPVPAAELVDYYRLCDVYVMPSKFEGFAIVFLEALSCGRPVVASEGFGCREALLDGRLGLTVEPDSREQIAAAIVRLLKDPPEQLADPGLIRATTLEHYDISAFRRRVGEAVRRAAAGG